MTNIHFGKLKTNSTKFNTEKGLYVGRPKIKNVNLCCKRDCK